MDRLRLDTRETRTISFTSGKGGVGKSVICVNTAAELAKSGKKVLILDGDMGLANVDIFLRAKPVKTLEQFFAGEARLVDVIIKVSPNLHFIPGANGLLGISQISHFQRKMLIDEVSAIENYYDYLLIDTASGIDDNVLYLNSAVQQICLVVLPEPTSLTDSYAMIKLMNKKFNQNRFSVICNQVLNEKEARTLFSRLNHVSGQFLNVSLDYKGFIPFDPKLRRSIGKKELITAADPLAKSSMAIADLARKLDDRQEIVEQHGGVQFFWNQIMGVA